MFRKLSYRHEVGGVQQFSLQRLEEGLKLGVASAIAESVRAVMIDLVLSE